MPDAPTATLLTSDEIMDVLRDVIDPALSSDNVDLGMLTGATVSDDGEVIVTSTLTTMGCPLPAMRGFNVGLTGADI